MGVGNSEKARIQYRDAANAPAATYFDLNSMLDQIYLFEQLGFRPDGVAAVKKVLEQRRTTLERIGGLKRSEPRFGQVVLASGHMIDKWAFEERFPARKEAIARDRMARQLDEWKIGAKDLAICGAAQGADLLFGELCAERGTELWLMLPLPEQEFLNESVRLTGTRWEQRYFDLRDRPGVKKFDQADRLKSAGERRIRLCPQQPLDRKYRARGSEQIQEPLRASRLGREANRSSPGAPPIALRASDSWVGGPPSSIQQRCSVVPTGLRVHGLTTRLVRE